jgi:hypothetical protein
MNKNVTKIAAGAAAVVAIGIGAAAVGSASSGNQSTRNASFGGPPGSQQAPPGANGRQSRQAGAVPPGFGTEATGTDADKAKQAALAKYPGTAERVLKLDDGSYVVHVITSDGSGERHVLVDADFSVTGAQTGGRGGPPPGGMMPPGGGSGQQPPSGAQPPSSGSTSGTVETN